MKLAFWLFLKVFVGAKKLSTALRIFAWRVFVINRILLAYDDSEASIKALDLALELAEKFSAKLLIVNVLEMPVFGSPDDPLASSAAMTSVVKDMRKAHEDVLKRAVERATNLKPAVQVTTELREGRSSGQIVEAAEKGNFDLIVLGHGQSGRLREFFLGGTSERVAHLAKHNLLIVK
jgi:nucleotide-binding universal stress UspA family protein